VFSVQFVQLGEAGFEKVPAKQETQADWPPSEKEPATQEAQTDMPEVGANVPGLQLAQLVAAAEREKVPTPQLTQEVDALREYWPAGHLAQAVAPAIEKVPAGHAPHEAEAARAKLPASHFLGYANPPAQDVPKGQASLRLSASGCMEKMVLRNLELSPQVCALLPAQGVVQLRRLALALGYTTDQSALSE